jgi:Protein of unknown function (DUF2911)
MKRVLFVAIGLISAFIVRGQQPSGIDYHVLNNASKREMTLIVDLKNIETNVTLSDVKCNFKYFDKNNQLIGIGQVYFTDEKLTRLYPSKHYEKKFTIKDTNAYFAKAVNLVYEYNINGQYAFGEKDSIKPKFDRYFVWNPPGQLKNEAFKQINSDLAIQIDYGTQISKGRTHSGTLLLDNQFWSPGTKSNGGTTFTFSDDVSIGGDSLKAGTYRFFVKPSGDYAYISFYNVENNPGDVIHFNPSNAIPSLETSVKLESNKKYFEKLTYKIDSVGKVDLLFEHFKLAFNAKQTDSLQSNY